MAGERDDPYTMDARLCDMDRAASGGRAASKAASAVQLVLALERPAGTPSLLVRAHQDMRNLRADCDWARDGDGWRSSNGWTVKRAWVGRHRDAWAAFAPDGVAEWGALDPVTAMVRAEGGS